MVRIKPAPAEQVQPFLLAPLPVVKRGCGFQYLQHAVPRAVALRWECVALGPSDHRSKQGDTQLGFSEDVVDGSEP